MPNDPNEEGQDDPSSSLDENTSDEGGGGEKSPRTAEARINELVAKTKELEEQLSKKQEQERVPTPPVQDKSTQVSPEAQKIVDQLKGLGVVFDRDLKTELETAQNRTALDNEHTRLERTYDGDDGRPKYDRSKVESYMRESGIYKPEAAYRDMHDVELTDWLLNKSGSQPRKPVSERSGSAVGTRPESDAITRDKISEMYAKGPQVFNQWYAKNEKKINTLLSQHKL